MKCEGQDWKGYALDELSAAERGAAELHLRECAGCREALERIRATLGALRALPQAELPRHIVLVSDRVLPEAWWRRLWKAGPAWGYASAAILSSAMLSGAILAHGWMMRPAGVDVATVNARVEAAVRAQVDTRLSAAVDAALRERLGAQVRPALAAATRELDAQEKRNLSESEGRLAAQREADQKAVRYAFERMERRVNFALVASARGQGGE